MITVKELIDELQKIEDKTLPVVFVDSTVDIGGMDCDGVIVESNKAILTWG